MTTRLQALLDDLEMFPDRADRIQMLIGLGERFVDVDSKVASRPFDERHRVPACESEVFVWVTKRADGTLEPHFAVENPQGISAKALAVLLKEGLTGATSSEIAALPDDVVYQVFGNELSMGKSLGLIGMIRHLKALAAAHP
ncbi:MAG TPA: SufE family protein [Fimbriimonadaceae bacterium]|nr:SufE family protein [Fimbriimonadaceae bacterium]HRJ96519.1 SufE family protein [Fimbriimonadaceae bacterium]